MADKDDDGFGEEAQRGFAADHSVDAYTQFYGVVLIAYRHRCALTGGRFDPPPGILHGELDVVTIQPREAGGPLAIANYLPMIASMTPLFRHGLITIEDDYRIVVPRPDALGPELISALRSTLLVPDEPALRPGANHLAYHRRYALGR